MISGRAWMDGWMNQEGGFHSLHTRSLKSVQIFHVLKNNFQSQLFFNAALISLDEFVAFIYILT